LATIQCTSLLHFKIDSLKRYKMKNLIWFALLAMYCTQGRAQEESHVQYHSLKGKHRVTLGLGHTQLSENKGENERGLLAVASWSLNYDYWISDQWAIGLQNDVLLESFVIETEHSEEIERHYPIAMIPVVLYKPTRHFAFIAGAGTEFAQDENLFLTRLGIEYDFQLPGNWLVGAAGVWDNNWDYYHSWGLSFTFSKVFGKEQ
jgi:hypothetical protein